MERKNFVAVYICLGSNLGDRRANLQAAMDRLAKSVGKLAKKSSIYETSPWGKTDQGPFLNQLAIVNTSLQPRELLETLQRIEFSLGRERKDKNGPRTIDLDILFYGRRVIRDRGLEIPHPEVANRMFVLVPLMEIDPEFVHPLTKKSLDDMIIDCTDEGMVVSLNHSH